MNKKRRAQLERLTGEYRRSRRFPGFAACLDMLHADVEFLEWGPHLLREHAADHVDELIQALQDPDHIDVRGLLLEAVGAAHTSAVVPLLATYLQSGEMDLRDRTIWTLLEIDTKESRRVLWEAQAYTFPTAEETVSFQERLAELLAGHRKSR